jgi:hypothetical protein
MQRANRRRQGGRRSQRSLHDDLIACSHAELLQCAARVLDPSVDTPGVVSLLQARTAEEVDRYQRAARAALEALAEAVARGELLRRRRGRGPTASTEQADEAVKVAS